MFLIMGYELWVMNYWRMPQAALIIMDYGLYPHDASRLGHLPSLDSHRHCVPCSSQIQANGFWTRFAWIFLLEIADAIDSASRLWIPSG